MALELDRSRIEGVIDALVNDLEGDWLLVGGALAALWLAPRRATEDVDLVALSGRADDRLRLMELAERVGLPIEAVNTAADFFVHRIPGWEQELELFRAGSRGRVFRPTPTLFIMLKAGRLSTSDLEDCLSAIRIARAQGLRLDVPRLVAQLDGLPATGDVALEQRRAGLRAALEA